MTDTIFRRLMLLAFALIAFTVFLVDSEVRGYIADRDLAATRQRLSDAGRLLAASTAGVSEAALQGWAETAAKNTSLRVTLIDVTGRVVADSTRDFASAENQLRRPEVTDALQKNSGSAVDSGVAYYALPVPERAGAPLILRLAAPLGTDDTGRGLRARVFSISVGSAVLALAIAYLISRSLSRRVGGLKRIAAGMLDTAQQDVSVDYAGDDLASLERSLAGVARELRRLLERLSFESARREAILSSMAEGVLAVDRELRVTFCNEAFQKAIGSRSGSVVGLVLLELVRDPQLRDLLVSVIATDTPRQMRIKLSVENPRVFAVHSTPLATPEGRGAIAIFHDTTELERLEQVRKDFVANVSHELRTPLAGIIGYADTLLDGGLNDAANRERFVEIIRKNAIRLNSIAADLLVLSELEVGGDPAEPDIISVPAVLDAALQIVESEAKSRSVRLIREDIDDLCVFGSRLRLEQVVLNLIANAIKFNRPGGEVRVRAKELEDGRVSIMVADTGVGIPSQDLPRIFERFYRVDKARSKEVGGTGLGLSIVKHAIERMSGSVAVESELGRGSRFTLFLPSAAPAKAE